MPAIDLRVSPLLGLWRIDETAGELAGRLDRKAWYAPFLERVSSEERRKEWLAVRVLLKTMLGREVRIAYTPAGAPYLPGETLRISISHTRGYAAVLLAAGENPGIDIEYRSGRIGRVAARVLSGRELEQLGPEPSEETLLLYWSAKETVFKAWGRQEVDFRKQIYVHPFPVNGSGRFRAEAERDESAAGFDIGYLQTDAYVLTYTACTHRVCDKTIRL